jgi:hypothetical protein
MGYWKIVVCSLLLGLSNMQASMIVKEEFLSQDITNFDCHSSSIVETGENQLCAVWKGGSGEGQSNINIKENVGIWSSLFDGGDHWSEPIILDDAGEFPAAIATSDGLIHVTYAVTCSQFGQRRVKHAVIDPARYQPI